MSESDDDRPVDETVEATGSIDWNSPLIGWLFIALLVAAVITAGLLLT